ncbi:MAG: PEP/pyruvate-binding domain-containing protein [Desulfopila sp.]
MRAAFTALKNLLFPAPPVKRSPEELRAAFARRYGYFRSLLTANNNALQAMAELEKLYYSRDSYRMAAIRSKVTTILINVYKMIRNLRDMSGGGYPELSQIFDKISGEVSAILERRPERADGPLSMALTDVRWKHRELVGEKMASLGELAALADMRVPDGFVMTASATRRFLTSGHLAEINRLLQLLEADDLPGLYRTCAEIRKMILAVPLPAEVEDALLAGYRRVEGRRGKGCRVALRSSGLGEDSAGVSFAGLYRTLLDVKEQDLVVAYKEVIAGKYGARAIAYRRRRGYRHEDIEMCVGCLAMVEAIASGVTYTLTPERGEQQVMSVNAVRGMGRGVVDGVADTDLFLLKRQAPYRLLGHEHRLNRAAEKEKTPQPVLAADQLVEVAARAMALEKLFGRPQDIEWSFDARGQLYILQSRPIIRAASAEQAERSADLAAPAAGEPPMISGGVCAAAGIACGRIFRAEENDQTGAFPAGGILVLEQPTPEWAPLVSRAAAVVAESGTEAGHLATIAREFGIPALFGLTGAMARLTPDELVTVNSVARSVYRGERQDLISRWGVRKDIMAGSPIQRILTEALQYITPLNLNDPTSLQFKAGWCETLHDITRFCHEKSVSEMFNLGRDKGFDHGAAKRLVGDVPLEWWVINLADGFKAGVAEESKAIHIEDIVSIPMLAIWEGISAYPWQGPPPISAKGFGSIIFQSTMRPDIDPAVATPLTAKNYFLISAHFCNLSVRLGYHYAMIESYLSDLLTESYVTFRFKGGAADMRRKAVRARLLADILRQYGFRVELRSDALLARVKKESADYLRDRLRILGYLILHARQLDMVMTQPHAVERYRQKFRQEIDAMLSGGVATSAVDKES